MELLWIIFITALAAAAAYSIGGMVDKRAMARQKAFDAAKRQQWLLSMSAFSLTCARRLADKGLYPRCRVSCAAQALSDCFLYQSGETLDAAEEALLRERLSEDDAG